MKRPPIRRLGVLAAALSAVVALAACGAGGRGSSGDTGADGERTASDVGVTETSIKLGSHYPLTGVAAPGYSDIPLGYEAYLKMVNANGGVHGRQIEWVYKDDGYNPTRTTEVVNELVLKDQVFAIAGGLGTPTHGAVVDFLNSEKVPDMFVASGSLAWGDDPKAKPYTFGFTPDYEIEGKIIGDWIKKNKPDAKVGLFLQADDLGADGEKGVRQFLDKEIVSVQRYTSGNTDVAPQLAALQADGADFVIAFNTPSYTALSQLQAMRLNYKPTWYYSNVGSDTKLVGSLLERFSEGSVKDSSALEGTLTTDYIAEVESADGKGWPELWQKIWAEYGEQGKPLTNYHIYGMSQAYAVVMALQEAGPNPTRDGLVKVMEEKGASWKGPWVAPFRFSATSHLGLGGLQMVELKGEKTEPIGPLLTTNIGDAPIVEGESQLGTPPENGIPPTG
ncbi:ABC transporter substrate-binding protein [Naumannella huperziae]